MALNIKSTLLFLLLAFYLYLIFNFLFSRTFEGVDNMAPDPNGGNPEDEKEKEEEAPPGKTSD
jgi:hypothetical protein